MLLPTTFFPVSDVDGMYVLQCQMLMGILFDVDGLSQLSMSVLMCARCFQLHLMRLVRSTCNSECSVIYPRHHSVNDTNSYHFS